MKSKSFTGILLLFILTTLPLKSQNTMDFIATPKQGAGWTGWRLFISNGNSFTYVKNGALMDGFKKIIVGDFNGDGKSDMLITGWQNYNWSTHQIHLSTGIGFERFEFPRYFDSNLKQVFVCDMNGDGRDDFFTVDKTSPSNGSLVRVMYYLNQNGGTTFSSSQGDTGYGLDKWNYQVGDFNGDGRGDYLVTSNWTGSNWNGYQLYNASTDLNNMLNTITDGLGNITTVSYKSMTDNAVHIKGNTNSYPVGFIFHFVENGG
ncbi:MAG: hypothetical protein BGO33_08690 [Bacteroidia bacterium 43-41]|nr:MAG: hypothetical protein BGO33_08690 [Bacteroidia bacterium 43-41]